MKNAWNTDARRNYFVDFTGSTDASDIVFAAKFDFSAAGLASGVKGGSFLTGRTLAVRIEGEAVGHVSDALLVLQHERPPAAGAEARLDVVPLAVLHLDVAAAVGHFVAGQTLRTAGGALGVTGAAELRDLARPVHQVVPDPALGADVGEGGVLQAAREGAGRAVGCLLED